MSSYEDNACALRIWEGLLEDYLSIHLQEANLTTFAILLLAGKGVLELTAKYPIQLYYYFLHTQCSIGIAGTGLAILLSVMCKMATFWFRSTASVGLSSNCPNHDSSISSIV
ncbi:unnamed protein product [Urochloa humidicola]